MTVGVTRIHPHAVLPAYKTAGAAAFDLYTVEDEVIDPGDTKIIGTGLVFDVPSGYVLLIVARSSTPIRHGLVLPHAVGVLDPDYCGPEDEAKIIVRNIWSRRCVIPRGTRLAQALVMPCPRVVIEERDRTVTDLNRGGIGSTGA